MRKIWLAAAVGVLAVVPRSLGLFQGIPDGLHPDEPIVIHRALYFASGDLNPHFFYYPSFSMYVTSGVIGVGTAALAISGKIHSAEEAKALFVQDPTPFYKMARIGTLIFGVLSVITLFLWGEKFIGTAGALCAAALCALTPSLVTQAHYAKPDALLAWIGLLAFFSCAESLRKKSIPWLYVSAFLSGLAFSTKYNAVPFALPTALIFFKFMRSQSWSKSDIFKHGSLLVVVFAAAFVLGTPFAVLDAHAFWGDFISIRSYTASAPAGPHGIVSRFFVHAGDLISHCGGNWPLGGLYVLGVAFVFFTKNSYVKMGAAVAIGFLCFISLQSLAYIRYFEPALPILIFSTVGALWPAKDNARTPWKSTVGIILLVLLAIVSTGETYQTIVQYRKPLTTDLAKRWIFEHCQEGAKIIADAGTPNLPLTRAALQQLADQADASGHIKGALFRLKLKYFNERQKHFDVYLSKQAVVITPPELLQSSRSVQRLASIDAGLESLVKQGFQYVITSSSEENVYRLGAFQNRYPAFQAYYQSLRSDPQAHLVFDTAARSDAAGPQIRIYKLAE